MQTGPDVEGIKQHAFVRPAFGVLPGRLLKSAGQQGKGMLGLLHHLGMILTIRQGRTKHKPVLQRMRKREGGVGAPHVAEIGIWVLAFGTGIEMLGERLEGACNDFCEQVVAAGKMSVWSLMRDLQASPLPSSSVARDQHCQ